MGLVGMGLVKNWPRTGFRIGHPRSSVAWHLDTAGPASASCEHRTLKRGLADLLKAALLAELYAQLKFAHLWWLGLLRQQVS
jgi:hypothetical protein